MILGILIIQRLVLYLPIVTLTLVSTFTLSFASLLEKRNSKEDMLSKAVSWLGENVGVEVGKITISYRLVLTHHKYCDDYQTALFGEQIYCLFFSEPFCIFQTPLPFHIFGTDICMAECIFLDSSPGSSLGNCHH